MCVRHLHLYAVRVLTVRLRAVLRHRQGAHLRRARVRRQGHRRLIVTRRTRPLHRLHRRLPRFRPRQPGRIASRRPLREPRHLRVTRARHLRAQRRGLARHRIAVAVPQRQRQRRDRLTVRHNVIGSGNKVRLVRRHGPCLEADLFIRVHHRAGAA